MKVWVLSQGELTWTVGLCLLPPGRARGASYEVLGAKESTSEGAAAGPAELGGDRVLSLESWPAW